MLTHISHAVMTLRYRLDINNVTRQGHVLISSYLGTGGDIELTTVPSPTSSTAKRIGAGRTSRLLAPVKVLAPKCS